MRTAGALKLFASRLIWRSTGLRAAGRAVVRALGSDDEDLRTIAGMFLVKAGKDAEPLLAEAMKRRENLPMVLCVLGDIGDRQLEPVNRRFSNDRDPRVAVAARDALEGLRDQVRAER